MRRFQISSLLIFAALTAKIECVAAAAAAAEADLADAAEKNDVALIERLLANKPDIDAPQADGTTALHWAAWHDQTRIVELLLQREAESDAANRYKVTPLVLAATNGNSDIVESLLKAGADPNHELDGGETVLMTASRTGRPDVVRLLLAAKADVGPTDWQGQTALMWAAAEGHEEVVGLLLKAGADPHVQLKGSGFTAFFFAAREGRTSAAMKLIEAGVDVNKPMQPARTNSKSPRNGMSALVLAIENGHFELASALLTAGADPNDQRSGYAPLHVLTWVRKPNRGDGADGEPPPQGSGEMTSLQFVERLVKAGADINGRLKKGKSGRGRLNFTGATPFLMAADTADLPYMKKLMELGADPRIPNADDCTPLMAAAGIGTYAPGEEAGTEEEALQVVDFLLELGFDINAVDRNGETAMHGAAYASWPAVVKFLDRNGANIKTWYQKNKYGWTPLLIAQGHRPGNFKPAPATIVALETVMKAKGVRPEAAGQFRGGNEYSEKKSPAATRQ